SAYVQWLLAVPAVGAILAPLNHRWSIGEAAAAVQQVGATVLAVDAHMLPWWAHLKPLCPSLRLGVLISDQPIPSSASSPSAALLSMDEVLLVGKRAITEAGQRAFNSPCPTHPTHHTASSPYHPPHSLASPSPSSSSFLHHIPLRFAPHRIALLCFTSGTTGTPKAAALSHTALISQSLAKLACAGYRHDDAFLHVAPLCHIGGISSLLAMLTACARNVLVPRFLPSHLPHLFSRHRITALIAVPAMLTDLVSACSGERQGESSTSFPLVRTLLVGGGALSPSLQRHTEALFPCARLMLAYGMTEAASSITFAMLRDPAEAEMAGAEREAAETGAPSAPTASASACCVGFPAPHVQVSIAPLPPDDPHPPPPPPRLDPHSSLPHQHSHSPLNYPALQSSQPSAHKSCPVVGEVLTRGPHVMSGYWGRPDETAAVLSPDGWLRTGDMGWIDFSGQIWLLGRRKEMIKSGGENVFCAEVEEAVRAHPGVVGAAAAGVPDERMGEAVAVLLVLKPGWVWSGISSNDSGGGDAGGAGGASDVGRFGSGGGSAARAAAAKNVSLSDLHAACQQHGLSSGCDLRRGGQHGGGEGPRAGRGTKRREEPELPPSPFLPLLLPSSSITSAQCSSDSGPSGHFGGVEVRVLELDEARTCLVVSEKRAAAAAKEPE
ncbi:unnamed protein product, partial [Closterium sp. NIES-54]